jgi:hypothetical protein
MIKIIIIVALCIFFTGCCGDDHKEVKLLFQEGDIVTHKVSKKEGQIIDTNKYREYPHTVRFIVVEQQANGDTKAISFQDLEMKEFELELKEKFEKATEETEETDEFNPDKF